MNDPNVQPTEELQQPPIGDPPIGDALPLYHFLLSHGASFFYGTTAKGLCGTIPATKRKSLKEIPNERFFLSILGADSQDVFICFGFDEKDSDLLVVEVPKEERMHQFVENANASSILKDNERSRFFLRTPDSVLFFYLNPQQGRFKIKRAGTICNSGFFVTYYPKGYFTFWGGESYESLSVQGAQEGSVHPLPPYLRPTSVTTPFFHKGRFKETLIPNDFYGKLGLPANFKGNLQELDDQLAVALEQVFLLYCNHYPYVGDYPEAILEIMEERFTKLLKEGVSEEDYDSDYDSDNESDDESTPSLIHKKPKPSKEGQQQNAKAEYHYTAKLYQTLFGEKWRYGPDGDMWYQWHSSYWLRRSAKDFFKVFKKVNIDAVSNRLYLGSSIAGMLAAIHTRLPIAQDVLTFPTTVAPLGVNFLNGFLDATTLKFTPDRAELPLFNVCNAHYTQTLPQRELIEKLASLVEYNETALFVIRSLIYRLIIPVEDLQTIICFTGLTDTGKSMLSKVLEDLVGSANCTSPGVASFSGRFVTREYIHKRLVVVTEADGISPAADNHFRKVGESQLVEEKGKQETYTAIFTGVFLILSNKTSSALTKRSTALRARLVPVRFVKQGAIDRTLKTFFLSRLGELVNWALGIPQEQLQLLIRSHKFVQGQGLDTTPIGRFVCQNFRVDDNGLIRMSSIRELYQENRETLSLASHISDEELVRELEQFSLTTLGKEIRVERMYVLDAQSTRAHLQAEGQTDWDDLKLPVFPVKRTISGAQRVNCIIGFRFRNNDELSLLDEVEEVKMNIDPFTWDKNHPLYNDWESEKFHEMGMGVLKRGKQAFNIADSEDPEDSQEDKPD